MQIKFLRDAFPENGYNLGRPDAKVTILNGRTDIDCVETRANTIQGRSLASQFHLALLEPNYWEGGEHMHILASAPTREDIVNNIKKGIKISFLGAGDLRSYCSRYKDSEFRQAFEVQGFMLK